MQRLFIIFLFLSLQGRSNNYYFSNINSSDDNSGSATSPWASWAKVNNTLAKAKEGDTLFFARGSSWYGGITVAHGPGVTMSAYGNGNRPVITGFSAITGWKEISQDAHIWEAPCNSGANLDEVLVKGVTVPAGRTPNAGSYFNINSYTKVSGSIGTVTSSLTPEAKQNWTGAEAVLRVNEYNLDRDVVIKHENTTITYASPANAKSIDGNGHKFFLQKHPATLDKQNEWYYDASRHVLQIYSLTDPSSFKVHAATINNFYKVDYSSHISFIGIKFTGMDSMAIAGRIPVKYLIDNCEFEDIGVDAISFDTDSSATISNCVFNRIGNSAIVARFSTKISIFNNVIDSCGLIKGMLLPNNQQGDGIMVEVYNKNGVLGDSTLIKNNTVTNVGFCGIRWTGTNALILDNFVDGYGFTHADGGGIYTNGNYNLKNKRVVSGNIVLNGHGNHDMHSQTGDRGMPGIYVDDDGGQVTIQNNTIADATRAAIFLHNATGIDVIANKIKAGKGEVAIGLEDDALGIAVRNINVIGNELYTLPGVNAIQLRSDQDDYKLMGKFSNNKYLRSTTGTLFNVIGNTTAGYPLDSWKTKFGWDEGSTVTQVVDKSVKLQINRPVNRAVKETTASGTLKPAASRAVQAVQPSSTFTYQKK